MAYIDDIEPPHWLMLRVVYSCDHAALYIDHEAIVGCTLPKYVMILLAVKCAVKCPLLCVWSDLPLDVL